MGIMISSFFIRTHPVWLFLYILFLGVAIFLSIYLGNAYYSMTINEVFADRLADQKYINFVMENIVWIILGVGALSLVIIFGKYNTVQGVNPI